VKRLSGSVFSAVLISDITGVIRTAGKGDIAPFFAASKSTVNEPCGAITSISSPALRLSPTQFEKTPPAIRLTVTLSCPHRARHSE
jgi:hypothetical protein